MLSMELVHSRKPRPVEATPLEMEKPRIIENNRIMKNTKAAKQIKDISGVINKGESRFGGQKKYKMPYN